MQSVVHNVVISHLADRICAAFSALSDSDDHIIWVYRGQIRREIFGLTHRMEHLLIWVDPHGGGGEGGDARCRHQKHLCNPTRSPPKENRDRDYGGSYYQHYRLVVLKHP